MENAFAKLENNLLYRPGSVTLFHLMFANATACIVWMWVCMFIYIYIWWTLLIIGWSFLIIGWRHTSCLSLNGMLTWKWENGSHGQTSGSRKFLTYYNRYDDIVWCFWAVSVDMGSYKSSSWIWLCIYSFSGKVM